jgi:hypothetical protein
MYFIGIKKQESNKGYSKGSVTSLHVLTDANCCKYIQFQYFASCRYNDVPLIYDKAIYEQLRDADIDHLLAQHIAHLFIRDSVSLFSEKVNQDDEQDTDHFEVCYMQTN